MLRRIKNFIKWGWRCKDVAPCDYVYLFELMLYQLKDMEVQLRTSGITVGGAKRAKEISRTIKLLEAYMEDDYCPKQWEKLDDYARKHSPNGGRTFMELIKLEGGGAELKTAESKQQKIHSKRQDKLRTKCYEKGKADFAKAMEIIKEKHTGWWD